MGQDILLFVICQGTVYLVALRVTRCTVPNESRCPIMTTRIAGGLLLGCNPEGFRPGTQVK